MARKPKKRRSLEVGDKLTLGFGRWAKSYKVVAIGPAVVVVRDGQGWTMTLLEGKWHETRRPAADRLNELDLTEMVETE